jgi:hypothetical protein
VNMVTAVSMQELSQIAQCTSDGTGLDSRSAFPEEAALSSCLKLDNTAKST